MCKIINRVSNTTNDKSNLIKAGTIGIENSMYINTNATADSIAVETSFLVLRILVLVVAFVVCSLILVISFHFALVAL